MFTTTTILHLLESAVIFQAILTAFGGWWLARG